jgi:ABC-2 type transport system ATP-binding protein
VSAPVADPPGRIVVHELTKVFRGNVRAVDRLSFTVEPGSVTGFLGPNGAGKTTTLRMVLGLVNPSGGTATIGGVAYRHVPFPIRAVGASLESSSYHPARTARNHLRVLCLAAGLPEQRADEVLELVGLRDAARRKVRGFSLGMRQRLGLGAALLGDPQVLVLDEPANGLDPEGIRWLRGLLRHLAGQGRTVLVSSHQLNEVQEIADRVVILNRGQLVRAGSIAELSAGTTTVLVRGPALAPLAEVFGPRGARVEWLDAQTLRLGGPEAAEVGHEAFVAGVELHELSAQQFDLEELFFALTGGAAPPPAGTPYGPPPGAPPGPPPAGAPYGGGAPWSA